MKPSAIVLFLAGALGACSTKSSEPRTPQPFVAPIAAEGRAEPAPGADEGVVRIAEDIRSACKLTQSEAYFAYNSASVRGDTGGLLDQLAACFTQGPLAGRQMRLVGHADPRGEDEYNLLLGSRRADSVQRVLVQKGMLAERVTTTSRGEMDARGADEAGWASDRRVDVVLGE